MNTRIRLLCRTLWGLLAFDSWSMLLSRRSPQGSSPFDVPHFSWMTALPEATQGLHDTLLFLVGLMAIPLALGSTSRLLRVLVFLGWTWGWSMSRLDSFQHHYFLSLVLFLGVFFPRPRQSTWSIKLLSAQMAIVYFFATVAKLEPLWLSGETLGHILGVAPGRSVQAMAVGSILLELLLSGVWLLTALSKTNKTIQTVGWLAAVSLHGGIALAGLHIGLFSGYMIALSTALLAPMSVVKMLEKVKLPRLPATPLVLVGVVLALQLVLAKTLTLELSSAVLASLAAATVGGVALCLSKDRSALKSQLVLSCVFWWVGIYLSTLEPNIFLLAGWVS